MVRRLLPVVVAAALGGCGGAANQGLYDAIHSRAPAEVTVSGTVTRVLADAPAGADGPHQRFSVDFGEGVTCEIDHNLALAPRVPLQAGTTLTVKGQYEPDPGGCVIHYTHHSTSRSHESGYIEVAGQQYG
jgi:hypothetical protein